MNKERKKEYRYLLEVKENVRKERQEGRKYMLVKRNEEAGILTAIFKQKKKVSEREVEPAIMRPDE